jgi:hypothetical protein
MSPPGTKTPAKPLETSFEVSSESFYATPPLSTSRTANLFSFHTPTPQPYQLSWSIHDPPTPSSPTKRKRPHETDENLPNSSSLSWKNTSGLPTKRVRRSTKSTFVATTDAEKLEVIWTAIKSVKWSLGQFFVTLSEWKDASGVHLSKEQGIAQAMRRFFRGEDNYRAGQVIHAWFTSPYGRLEKEIEFETATPYQDIRPMRNCLRAFAAQTVKQHLVREAEAAVMEKQAGKSLRTKQVVEGVLQRVEWLDIGSMTVSKVGEIIRTAQPLLWRLLSAVAARPGRTQAHRPVDIVSITEHTTFILFLTLTIGCNTYHCGIGFLKEQSSTTPSPNARFAVLCYVSTSRYLRL